MHEANSKACVNNEPRRRGRVTRVAHVEVHDPFEDATTWGQAKSLKANTEQFSPEPARVMRITRRTRGDELLHAACASRSWTGTIFSSPRACRSRRSCPPRVNSTRRPFSAASPASARTPRRSPWDGFLRARGVTQRVARSMRRHAIDVRRTGDWRHSQSTSSLHDGAKRRVPIPRVARFADVVHALNANEHFC